jgi:hypothetical protein
MTYFLKKGELKAVLCLTEKGKKRPAREKNTTDKKKERLL